MKMLVETTGQFQLWDASQNFLIEFNRPCVLPANSAFVQTQFGRDQLSLLAQVADEATDAEFQKYWAESGGDKTLAIESFIASFVTPEPEPEKKAKKK